MNEILSKIKTNFFSILLPGFYILLCFSILVMIIVINIYANENIFKNIIDFLKDKDINNPSGIFKSILDWIIPFIVLIILTIAYLIGNILRGASVDMVDKCKKKDINDVMDIKTMLWSEIRKATNFPYPAILKKEIEYLYLTNKTKLKPIRTMIEEALKRVNTQNVKKEGYRQLMTWFKIFKLTLCNESPNIFAFTQTYEERVRLFAGMIWAGRISLVFNLPSLILSIILSFFFNFNILFPIISGLLSVVSFGLWIFLRKNIRHIRVSEVDYTFLGYIYSILNKKTST